MKLRSKLLGIFITIALVSPSHASVREAAFAGTADKAQAQTSIFAGATYRVSFDHDAMPSGRAALNLSGMRIARAAAQVPIGRGIEVAPVRRGKVALQLAGANIGQLHRTGNVSGGGKTALIVVGALAVAAIVALVVVDSLKCEDEGNTCD